LTEQVAASASVSEALGEAVARLRAASVETPRLDAELLLGDALGVGRSELVLRASEVLDEAASARFDALLRRREGREPVAYILGRKAFRHIELAVDPRVLIPRPETELLVEVGLEFPSRSRVVDVGTGSGAVALALKDERPDLEILGTDISAEAVAVARANASALGVEVEFVETDLLTGVEGRVNAVLANLPYVTEGFELPPEISSYEPPAALFAGSDGLDVIRRLIAMLDGVGAVALEVGFDQADAVGELLRGAGFQSVERLRDLAGHERVVIGRRIT
jgi:release factor glutamine methyltransferase